jgi:ATP-dependent RNA circularization protein (DNA/RNA ligase family)
MSVFFRFPHTPHLAWLASDTPRDDKVLSPAEVATLLSGEAVVEEKLDGANLGVSVDEADKIRVQNRGQYLNPPYGGQFSRITAWLNEHQDVLAPALGKTLILFGEWCAARHSVRYDHLPDWLVAFDIYDRATAHFWSTKRRDDWAARAGLCVVPHLARGRMSLAEVKDLSITSTSRFGAGPLEGVIIRREGAKFLEQRAKLVRPDFTQAITDHWRSRRIEWNAVRQTSTRMSRLSFATSL